MPDEKESSAGTPGAVNEPGGDHSLITPRALFHGHGKAGHYERSSRYLEEGEASARDGCQEAPASQNEVSRSIGARGEEENNTMHSASSRTRSRARARNEDKERTLSGVIDGRQSSGGLTTRKRRILASGGKDGMPRRLGWQVEMPDSVNEQFQVGQEHEIEFRPRVELHISRAVRRTDAESKIYICQTIENGRENNN